MASGRERLIRQLEKAADNIGDMQRHELQVLLRRAALMIRNIDSSPPDPEGEYRALVDEMNDDPDGAA